MHIIQIRVICQIQNLCFCDGQNLCDIFSRPEFPVVKLDTMNGFSEFKRLMYFHDRKNGITTVTRVAIAAQFVIVTDEIDCSIFIRTSHIKDCLTIAIFFSFSY